MKIKSRIFTEKFLYFIGKHIRKRLYHGASSFHYDNFPPGNTDINVSAGLSKRYTNPSPGEISTCLDKKEFASRHIVSVTGHKIETHLKRILDTPINI